MCDAVPLGDDRNGVGIPFRQLLALGDGGAFVGKQLGAVRHAVTGLLARGLDRADLGAALDGAADVEGAHRELGPGLADRLGGDDADRLADIDDGAAGKVAPVALAADADWRLAGQYRADADGIDAGTLDPLDLL